MRKWFTNKLVIFVALIAIGIFSILGLNEFASPTNQENHQKEIATETKTEAKTETETEAKTEAKTKTETFNLNEEETDGNLEKEVDESAGPESKLDAGEKTGKHSTVEKEINQTTETKSVIDSRKQEASSSEQSKQQKEKVELNKENNQVIQDKPEKIIEKKSNTEEEKNEIPTLEAKKSTVLVTIVGPKDIGTILDATQIEISESDTVLDTLQRATREKKIQMEFRGTNASAYVEGINNLYEFDRGPESGWMYSVNGVFPNKSAGSVVVKANDNILWLYTEDLGKDIGTGQ